MLRFVATIGTLTTIGPTRGATARYRHLRLSTSARVRVLRRPRWLLVGARRARRPRPARRPTPGPRAVRPVAAPRGFRAPRGVAARAAPCRRDGVCPLATSPRRGARRRWAPEVRRAGDATCVPSLEPGGGPAGQAKVGPRRRSDRPVRPQRRRRRRRRPARSALASVGPRACTEPGRRHPRALSRPSGAGGSPARRGAGAAYGRLASR